MFEHAVVLLSYAADVESYAPRNVIFVHGYGVEQLKYSFGFVNGAEEKQSQLCASIVICMSAGYASDRISNHVNVVKSDFFR